MSVEGINTRPFIYKIGDIVETNSVVISTYN